jgi:Transposase DNA-binding/Transposase DDE domain
MRNSVVEGESAIAGELAEADFGDIRLGRRLGTIAARLTAAPSAAFPQALGKGADLEAFYRFIRNDAVKFEALLQPHVTATVGRCAQGREVLAVHDTSEFRFGGVRKDLGRLGQSGRGFLGHFTIAVSADDKRDPLGTLGVETWTRTAPTPTALRKQKQLRYEDVSHLPNEQDRWWRAIAAAEKAVKGRTSLIHVMDSEADDYDLMSKLIESHLRWVIRLCYDRLLVGVSRSEKTKEVVARARVLCRKKVHLSRRRRQPGGAKRPRTEVRESRLATLAISASAVTFRRPSSCKDSPDSLSVNIVSVREVKPPRDQEPVEWLLITTEPIHDEQEILKVVDCYRGRWRIEEFFKALKTGCAVEKRQLDSKQTLLNALALFIPVAWHLLRLRTAARSTQRIPAQTVLDDDQLLVLRRASGCPLPKSLMARDALLAIARLGGHLSSNGDPGWQVLGRGYQDLLMMVAGYRLATGEM